MSRTNSERLDELLSWLTESHALLSTKMKDAIPDDLTVVEALLREHMVFCFSLFIFFFFFSLCFIISLSTTTYFSSSFFLSLYHYIYRDLFILIFSLSPTSNHILLLPYTSTTISFNSVTIFFSHFSIYIIFLS